MIEFDLIGLPSPLHSRIKIGLRAQGIGSSALANIALAKQAIESQRISGLIALPRSLQDSTALVSGTISVLSPLGAIIRKLEVFADLADALAAVCITFFYLYKINSTVMRSLGPSFCTGCLEVRERYPRCRRPHIVTT